MPLTHKPVVIDVTTDMKKLLPSLQYKAGQEQAPFVSGVTVAPLHFHTRSSLLV